MRLSEIQNKDVIDIISGIKIGNIIDIKINQSGDIVALILEKKIQKKFFSSGDEIEVRWNQIKRIGEDVILVESIEK